MSTIPSNISNGARGVVRASNSCGRLWFSTSKAVRGGSGSFFNLGGLGASREAQYLSKERGIPRTEYNSNIHLIRSSEVDPFAPAPGSTRAAAARAAARAEAEAEAESQLAAAAARHAKSCSYFAARDGQEGVAGLEAQLQAVKDELAETKRALRAVWQMKLGRRRDPAATSTGFTLLSSAIIITAVYFIFADVSERATRRPRPAEGLIQAQAPNDQVDEATAQRRRDAPLEEQVLAESGLTSFENQPEVPDIPRRSVLSGLFWART
ncbi:hypothetical protein F5883DRAFT_651174 [Diaporthe sp. PMI_573]|nr:hypothetical protein F5883DRAFT_651174 [Diaporthaceae sp. PMI_573]